MPLMDARGSFQLALRSGSSTGVSAGVSEGVSAGVSELKQPPEISSGIRGVTRALPYTAMRALGP